MNKRISLDTSKLPKSLSKEEITKLFYDFKNGDTSARNKIIEHNIRLVIYEVMNKFYNIDYDKDELVSTGIMGLIKAVDTYNPDNNIAFATYAVRCIDNELLMLIRKLKKISKVDSLDKVVAVDKNYDEQTLEDIIPSDIDITENIELDETNLIIRKIVNALPDKDKEIIFLRYGFKDNKIYTQEEVSKIFGISRSYISRLEKVTLSKISKKLYEIGITEKDNMIKRNKRISRKLVTINTIYEYFYKHSKEEVDVMILKLNLDELNFLKLIFGDDLVSATNIKLTKEQNVKYSTLRAKMKRYLDNPNSRINKERSGSMKRVKTIYEYFNNYTKEEINSVLLKELNDNEKELLLKRYGNDLNNPSQTTLTKNDTDAFYGSLIPKIRRILSKKHGNINKDNSIPINNNNEILKKEEKDVSSNTLNNESKDEVNEIKYKTISVDEYNKIIQLLKSDYFNQLENNLSKIELLIISLKLGYIDGKQFSTESIASFLEIKEDEVRNITKNALLKYRNVFVSLFDDFIETVNTSNEVKKYIKI